MSEEEDAGESHAQENETPSKPSKARRKGGAGKASKKAQKAPRRRRSTARPFPASTFEEALTLADGIQRFASGERVRRLTLFDKLGRPPESGPSRQLITNSSRYGLSTGGYQSESLELTADGRTATSSESDPINRLQTRFKLAIEQIAPF